MGKHKPTLIWAVKPIGKYPQVYLKTNGPGFITMTMHGSGQGYGVGFTMSRRDARLLAKRLNQCLDVTK